MLTRERPNHECFGIVKEDTWGVARRFKGIENLTGKGHAPFGRIRRSASDNSAVLPIFQFSYAFDTLRKRIYCNWGYRFIFLLQ